VGHCGEDAAAAEQGAEQDLEQRHRVAGALVVGGRERYCCSGADGGEQYQRDERDERLPHDRVLFWGNGNPTKLIGTRGATELRGLSSKADAEKLQDFYRSAEIAGRGGTTAPARVKLTREIIDAWGG
jgi:hypothetical protein